MTDVTQAPPPRLGECFETLPDTFEALVGAPGAWVPASFVELAMIDTQPGGLRPELLLNLARAVDAAGRVCVPTRGWGGFRRISFAHAGAARDLGDDFLRECDADEVDYAGCTSVARVGDNWMEACGSLAAPVFKGLGALAAVGTRWMSRCASLTAPDFTALGALVTVGDRWMWHCASLAAPDFTALGALAAVGDSWMQDCRALAALDFAGLGALAAVGSYWMAGCNALVAIDSDPAGLAAHRAAVLRLRAEVLGRR
jgi:hypothetical protein